MGSAEGLQGQEKTEVSQESDRKKLTQGQKGLLSKTHLSRTMSFKNPCQLAECYRRCRMQDAGSHLDVIMGVPVRIEDDDSVSSGQVDAQATSSGGQEKAELLGTRS